MNNNNRYNGQSVRPVCVFSALAFCYYMKLYHLTSSQLLTDLYEAYFDARRHKRNKPYQLLFESNLAENLQQLCNELWRREYHPQPSSCFIIADPKKREVFAAAFRDRIVHHLYYNYVHEMLERTFIQDSYSCIRGRGTHYGIRRMEHHIRQESQNYQEPCYVLKLDIQGYFMHINRERLLKITLCSLHRMAAHRISRYRQEVWAERVDMDFVCYLTREIVMLDPTLDCQMRGDRSDWEMLPASKSLFHSPAGYGLPIGNLTSQLFSNVYLNELDQYMKRTLHCRHYGRYVDDFYVVSADRSWLQSLLPHIRAFLHDNIGLSLHAGKLRINDVRKGVEFLGAYLKPWRNLVSHTTMRRISRKISTLVRDAQVFMKQESFTEPESHSIIYHRMAVHLRSSLNSFCGVLSHYRSYHLRQRLWLSSNTRIFLRYGYFTSHLMHYTSFPNFIWRTNLSL